MLGGGKPKNLQLTDVTFNKTEFDPTFDYGKSTRIDVKQKSQLS
jgi:hypothetical protein